MGAISAVSQLVRQTSLSRVRALMAAAAEDVFRWLSQDAIREDGLPG